MKVALLGGTGRTGRIVLERLLAGGHSVRALVRRPEQIRLRHDRLILLRGDAVDAGRVRELVLGVDAVVSTVGPRRGAAAVCSRATANVIAAIQAGGPRRYLCVSGAAVDAPGDHKDLGGRLLSRLVRLVAAKTFADKQRELHLLLDSGSDWTAARPPRLVDRPLRGDYRVSTQRAPSPLLGRADLADFLIRELDAGRHLRQAPFVAY